MELRPYQHEAVAALRSALAAGSRPVAQLATGTGKSLIIAELARLWRGPVLVLAHVKELIAQNEAAYAEHTGDRPGVYCSGLGRRELDRAVTFATVQSIQSALKKNWAPTLVVIDEAHRVPNLDTPGGLFHKVLARYPGVAVCGLTATPWRLAGGKIYGPDPAVNVFNECAYEFTVRAGVDAGYLAPLVGVEPEAQLDTAGLRVRQGDYVVSDVEPRLTEAWMRTVAQSMKRLASKRQHIALYAPTVTSARMCARVIAEETKWPTEWLSGELAPSVRDQRVADFKSGAVRVLCSVDILTTGFNMPGLDCIVSVRPTQSSALWQQIMGRGTRTAPGKENCLLLDYAGNLDRIGGVDCFPEYIVERGGQVVRTVRANPAERPKPPAAVSQTVSRVNPMHAAGQMIDALAVSADVVVLPWKKHPGRHMLLVKFDAITDDGNRIAASQFIFPNAPEPYLAAVSKAKLAHYGALRWIDQNIHTLKAGLRSSIRLPLRIKVAASGRYWNVI